MSSERPQSPVVASQLVSEIGFLHEAQDTPLSLEAARKRFESGNAQSAAHSFLTFGIGSKPVWVRLGLDNPTDVTLRRRLTAAETWIDQVDVYQVTSGGLLHHWQAGDAKPRDRHLLPAVGLVFDVDVPPGQSAIYIRGQTFDPMTLPIALLSAAESRTHYMLTQMAYGLLYGILLTLIAYNLLLYRTFKLLSALAYSIYIGSFIMLNTGYVGYGSYWLYPESPQIQNYLTLLLMVLHGICGLSFALAFLSVKENLPRVRRAVLAYMAVGLVVIVPLIIARNQLYAATFAFGYLSLTTLVMIVLGVLSRKHIANANTYLAAVLASMIGVLATALTVWGAIPYTHQGYHAAEFGVVIEAVLLALILGKKLKAIETERIDAQYLSSHDALTNLHNRRSFLEVGNKLLHVAVRKQRPMSLVLIDIDHFKAVNDRYGHQTGDRALVHLARLLMDNVRDGDIVARWGGEEIVLLLPETTIDEAVFFAERLRTKIASTPMVAGHHEITMTVCFGVASRKKDETLDNLFGEADRQLYSAKAGGRNRVEPHAPLSAMKASA
ncbi:diguanylate cyclase [Marinobacter nanhaiticus]|uniref:diguanylate cyclase n=1 Tax=Marinobacter nanhaiticus TaxID=1305740 RepID=UPI0014615229|nr:diguanylate cyclase [Marinobacter nanhaiticus]